MILIFINALYTSLRKLPARFLIIKLNTLFSSWDLYLPQSTSPLPQTVIAATIHNKIRIIGRDNKSSEDEIPAKSLCIIKY